MLLLPRFSQHALSHLPAWPRLSHRSEQLPGALQALGAGSVPRAWLPSARGTPHPCPGSSSFVFAWAKLGSWFSNCMAPAVSVMGRLGVPPHPPPPTVPGPACVERRDRALGPCAAAQVPPPLSAGFWWLNPEGEVLQDTGRAGQMLLESALGLQSSGSGCRTGTEPRRRDAAPALALGLTRCVTAPQLFLNSKL